MLFLCYSKFHVKCESDHGVELADDDLTSPGLKRVYSGRSSDRSRSIITENLEAEIANSFPRTTSYRLWSTYVVVCLDLSRAFINYLPADVCHRSRYTDTPSELLPSYHHRPPGKVSRLSRYIWTLLNCYLPSINATVGLLIMAY